MPRKSSKTAHVLNLLTSNKDETPEQEPEKKEAKSKTDTKKSEDKPSVGKAEYTELLNDEKDISKAIEEVIPEIMEEHIPISESISEMKETVSEILSEKKDIPDYPMETIVPTIEQKHDYNMSVPQPVNNVAESTADTASGEKPFPYMPSAPVPTPDIMPSPLPKSAVASMIIAQKKEEEKVVEEPEEPEIASEAPVYEEKDMTLVNLTEKAAARRIPEIMQKFNMCSCERCYYDVLALTLNSVPQKTVIVPREDIERKMNEYELDSTIDIVTAISKSCVHVKISPRHQKKHIG